MSRGETKKGSREGNKERSSASVQRPALIKVPLGLNWIQRFKPRPLYLTYMRKRLEGDIGRERKREREKSSRS